MRQFDLRQISTLTLLFFAFSVAGWIMEVVLKSIQYRRFMNRGILIGPYCPIYGWGALMVTLLMDGFFLRRGTIGETFLAGFFVCGALEYLTSYVMEKTSHIRWWDYSNKPMNLQGRVWIGNLLLFGLASVAIVHVIDPLFFSLLARMQEPLLEYVAFALIGVMLIDSAISHFLVGIIKKNLDAQKADDTEEIKRQVGEMLRDRALLLRRIDNAYPDWQPRPGRLSALLRQARAEYKQSVRRAKDELRAAQKALSSRRQKVGQWSAEYWRDRVAKARAAQKQALRKLREIEEKLSIR